MRTHIQDLERLSALKQSGALSAEEFDEQKRKLLSGSPASDTAYSLPKFRIRPVSKTVKRGLIIAGPIVLALLVGWWWFSPYWALQGMQAALKDRDADAFAEYIDFPRLRSDLKSDAFAELAQEANSDNEMEAGFAVLGASMAGPMIDGMVSPEGLRALFAMKDPDGRGFGIMEVSAEDVEVSRSGLTRFEVSTSNDTKLIFGLSGLSWKLVGVDQAPNRSASSNLARQADLGSNEEVPSAPDTSSSSGVNFQSVAASTLVGDWASDQLECSSDAPLRLRGDGTIPAFAGSLEEPIDASWSYDKLLTIRSEGVTYRYDVKMPDPDSLFLTSEDEEELSFIRC